MVRVILFILMYFITVSCSSPYYKLADGQKVLKNKYTNIKDFNKTIFNKIDTAYFYKKVDYYIANKNYKKVRDIGTDVDRTIQFYGNGRVRFFSFNYLDANPEVTGRRGIIYQKRGNIKIDTQFADNWGRVSKGAYSVKIKNDTLFLYDDNTFLKSEFICMKFVKYEKIPEDWNKYRAEW